MFIPHLLNADAESIPKICLTKPAYLSELVSEFVLNDNEMR